MARVLGLFPASLIAARADVSANAFYRQLRDEGIAARRSEVLSLYKLARSIVATGTDEIFRDPRAVPSERELSVWPTRNASTVRQNVTLIYRDRTTGTINRTFWATSSEEGITREQAMAQAIDAYSSHAERYNQDLIGAVHTGAYRYMPFEAPSDLEPE